MMGQALTDSVDDAARAGWLPCPARPGDEGAVHVADRPMKFSTFHLFHQFAGQTAKEVYEYQIEVVELLEELGFDGVWVAEHHFRDYGVVPNIFTLLANLAGRTERLRLGTGIVV